MRQKNPSTRKSARLALALKKQKSRHRTSDDTGRRPFELRDNAQHGIYFIHLRDDSNEKFVYLIREIEKLSHRCMTQRISTCSASTIRSRQVVQSGREIAAAYSCSLLVDFRIFDGARFLDLKVWIRRASEQGKSKRYLI